LDALPELSRKFNALKDDMIMIKSEVNTLKNQSFKKESLDYTEKSSSQNFAAEKDLKDLRQKYEILA
jgi:hypothetical protein